MTRSNVIMASAPTSSAARSQAWISTVIFTAESQHIGPGAAPLGRSRGRRPARWDLWWWSHRGLCGGGDVGGPASVVSLPVVSENPIQANDQGSCISVESYPTLGATG